MGTTNELMHRHVQAAVPPLPTPGRGMAPGQGQGGRQRAGLPPTPPSGAGSHSLHVADACMRMQDDSAPRKAHRRSRSDVPFGYFPPPSPKTESGWGLPGGGAVGGDELFNAFMSMEGMDGLNSSDGDSRGSSMPPANGADSSENESEDYGGVESQVFLWGEAGKKRNADGEPTAAAAARHARSLSMDSLMGKLSFSANGGEPSKFSLEFGSGEFTPAEMKRIMADEKLAEMALADPKRVKRVLANRQSAARSKERRMRYIAELEHKVQILQTEATTLSAQLTHLQRDSSGLATHNNELKFRLQAMEQQAQLRDALNEALTGEVQRLKQSATSERGGDAASSGGLAQQMQLRCQNQMLEMHKQQQIPFYQLEQPEQTRESN
ncbi:transcription factor RF2b-like [Hordeum vulgare]|uniref:BZIP domain-containing protein n=1 Tax=Hordeum vulgare subsp. vulgare TaxID=112509 RepID=A0A8I6WTL4_HORVV|nr:bZIP transcription factor 29-like [Hordeum vulgare subsp. vulgare]KAE8769383.1 transcription factor RF2b-like [Hordeum vulgare]